jgi:uncharacterized membrane protein YbaN (DUF454 family)
MAGKEDRPTDARSRVTRLLLVTLGHVSLVLGLLGIALPLLPTTPFLLLAAACYVRGSESTYGWLMNQRVLGPYIASYREGGGISQKQRIALVLLIWVTIPASAMLLVDALYVRLTLLAIASLVSVVIWRLPRRQAADSHDDP